MEYRTKSQKDTALSLLEFSELYRDRCDFTKAIEKGQEAAELFLEAKDFDNYLKVLNLLLRIHAERQEYDQVHKIKEKLQDLVLKEKCQLNEKTYYTLGICAVYKKQLDLGLEYFQKSLALALERDNKKDISYAIHATAIVYSKQGQYERALREIYNLEIFFQALDLGDLKLGAEILNGFILYKLDRYEQALQIFWKAYESVKVQKNLFMYLHLLYGMGVTYKASGEKEMAGLYLKLAKKLTDTESLKTLVQDINEALKDLGVVGEGNYDLIFNATAKSLFEKKKGKIDFKNQFILLDLLHLFLQKPGHVFSKKSIVEQIWNQSYDPPTHDNKIYVTIKRLRKLIEADYDKPKYIFRAKNGYYLNKTAKVYLEA